MEWQYLKNLLVGVFLSFKSITTWIGIVSFVLTFFTKPKWQWAKFRLERLKSHRGIILLGLIFISVILTSHSMYKNQRQIITKLHDKVNASRTEPNKVQLSKEIESLVKDINQFQADRKSTEPTFGSDTDAFMVLQERQKYAATSDNRFATRYKLPLLDIINQLLAMDTISQKEANDLRWKITNCDSYIINQITQKLLEFSQRLK